MAQSDIQLTETRNVLLRIVFSILWFTPVILIIQMAIGGFLGGMEGVSNPEAGVKGGYELGRNASIKFFSKYGKIVYIGETLAWLILCATGALPGTGKYKKTKKK